MGARGDSPAHRQQVGAWHEFAHGWRVLLGASFGVGLGIAGLLTYNLQRKPAFFAYQRAK